MTPKPPKICLLIFLALSLFASTPVSAAGLVPFGGRDEAPCTFCDLFKLGQNIINFLVVISSILAVAFIIFGGIMMMIGSSSPEKLKGSKNIIWSAIIGLIILSCSWVILNTFFHLMTGGLNWPWYQIQCYQ